jgi:hypothetical protein
VEKKDSEQVGSPVVKSDSFANLSEESVKTLSEVRGFGPRKIPRFLSIILVLTLLALLSGLAQTIEADLGSRNHLSNLGHPSLHVPMKQETKVVRTHLVRQTSGRRVYYFLLVVGKRSNHLKCCGEVWFGSHHYFIASSATQLGENRKESVNFWVPGCRFPPPTDGRANGDDVVERCILHRWKPSGVWMFAGAHQLGRGHVTCLILFVKEQTQ